MRTIMIALVALLSTANIPASAQFYGGGGGWYQEDEDYAPPRYRPRDFYERDYGRRFRADPDEFYERDYAPRRYRESYEQPRSSRQRFGRVCVTARGNCPAPPGPLNTPCGCMIPGFGPKRGAIGF